MPDPAPPVVADTPTMISLSRKLSSAANSVKDIHDSGRKAIQTNDPSDITLFECKYSTLNRYFNKYEDAWDALVDAYISVKREDDFPSEAYRLSRTKTRAYYYECISLSKQISRQPDSAPIASTSNSFSGGNITVESRMSDNLPKINIPIFEGNILDWPKWRDTYVSVIHSNEQLSLTHKFHYLSTSLRGLASNVINHIKIQADSYGLAWTALTEAFDNKRMLANAYLNQILSFKPLSGKPTVDSLKSFMNKISDNIATFKLLNIPDEGDFLLFYLAVRCLDASTREQFEVANKHVAFPTFDLLNKFIKDRCLALQFSQCISSTSVDQDIPGKRDVKPIKPSFKAFVAKDQNFTNKYSASNQNNTKRCFICQSNIHPLRECPVFKSASVEKRHDFIKNWKGCRNCLANNHSTHHCESTWRCKECSGKHNSLLHFPKPVGVNNYGQQNVDENVHQPSTSFAGTLSAVSNKHLTPTEPRVILGTIIAEFKNIQGQFVSFRGLVDCGSEHSFITIKCVNKLGLTFEPTSKTISGIGETIFEGAKGRVSCHMRPKNQSASIFNFEAIVVRNITGYLPSINVPAICATKFSKYDLADPHFWRPGPIDFLLGADLYANVISGGPITIEQHLPKMFPSIFGNIIMGPIIDQGSSNPYINSLLVTKSNDDLNENLSKFWELEEVPCSKQVLAPEEEWCENHFIETHRRSATGQYVIQLPFKSDVPDLRESGHTALKRFHNLEFKLKKNENLYSQYRDFMIEYVQLDHMSPTISNSSYIIPHHAVTKEDRNKIKLRVVFDASAKTREGSLNEFLHAGPKLQNDIRNILLNWRTHAVVIVADIVKMYRQIIVNEKDRCFQHIYWRDDPSDALQKFELKTLTYGMTCSPWLALRVLKQLIKDEGSPYPNASNIITHDIFIDDVVSGAKTVTEALKFQSELIDLLNKGGFELKKWASNNKKVLEKVNDNNNSSEPISFIHETEPTLKILGLIWFPDEDCFSYRIKIEQPLIFTKRRILSLVASLYDPLCFLAPTTILMKHFIQLLWKANVGWDDTIPSEIQKSWIQIIHELPLLSKLRIPRFVCDNHPSTSYQLIGFADASSKAYCATIYIRIIQSDKISVHLLTSKTRLAPVKTVSIPRLELCGVVLLAKLYKSLTFFINRLDKSVLNPIFFTDSSVVLGWLNTLPCNLKVFVANRVSEVLDLTAFSSWRHVSTKQNPSDIASRGMLPSQILSSDLWWKGPSWLELPEKQWPKSLIDLNIDLPEMKGPQISLHSTSYSCLVDTAWMNRFSNYFTLIRVSSRIMRMFHNYKNPHSKITGEIKQNEFHSSLMRLIKLIQQQYFGHRNQPCYESTIIKYSSLDIFIDDVGILRVGGRLRHAPLPLNQKHPILLPKKCHFSKLLVDMYHYTYMHPGRLFLQGIIQLKYWIPGLRTLIQERLFHCITCYKHKAKTHEVKMGDLPSYRFFYGNAFVHVGTDFAGPIMLRESLRRKSPLSKGYLCLFVCLSTKALHLELVTNLTTECFLAAFNRFVARRGLPTAIYSDNGKTYVGAANKMKEFWEWYQATSTLDTIVKHSSKVGVQWHFMPAYSPNFSGMAEAGVKSTKTLLRKVVGDACLSYEEAFTLLHKIEAILNSRPLGPLSADPTENNYLSPGHFLIGRPLVANPEPSVLNMRENTLSRWQLVQRMSEHFWNKWRIEYLSTLQNRVKWHKYRPNHPELKVDDIVLIKEDNVPPLRWPMGRIVEVHPGKDNHVRVATIQTASSTFKRPIRKLIPLHPVSIPSFE